MDYLINTSGLYNSKNYTFFSSLIEFGPISLTACRVMENRPEDSHPLTGKVFMFNSFLYSYLNRLVSTSFLSLSLYAPKRYENVSLNSLYEG